MKVIFVPKNFKHFISIIFIHLTAVGLNKNFFTVNSVLGIAFHQNIKKICDAPLQNYTGQTTLSELTRLLVKSQILIGNETGTAHIANAVGTPTICILGGGHFGRFAPYPELSGKTSRLKVVYHKMPCYGCDWKCVYHIKEGEPAPCISNISVDAVWNEVKLLL